MATLCFNADKDPALAGIQTTAWERSVALWAAFFLSKLCVKRALLIVCFFVHLDVFPPERLARGGKI